MMSMTVPYAWTPRIFEQELSVRETISGVS